MERPVNPVPTLGNRSIEVETAIGRLIDLSVHIEPQAPRVY
jgi:hypothetical protein